jgi:hypothetical protein
VGELQIDFAIMDYCVLPGQLPKQAAVFTTALQAVEWAKVANSNDDKAKAAFDSMPKFFGVDFAAPGTKDRTTFSFDVETHAKRYFIGPGMDNALYGSATAIDSLRAKLNGRYHRIQELTKVNITLRANLKDAQSTANDFKSERDKLAAAWQECHNHESVACRDALATAQDDARMVRIQRDSLQRQLTRAEGDYSELKGAVIALASNL